MLEMIDEYEDFDVSEYQEISDTQIYQDQFCNKCSGHGCGWCLMLER